MQGKKSVVVAAGIMVVGLSMVCLSQTAGQEPSASDSDTVVVTATRVPHVLSDVGISVTAVPKEQIEETAPQNVGEVLDQVAGARVSAHGGMGGESSVHIRGSTANQVLIMVDGRLVNLPSVGSADLSMYPVNTVERIEVIRGPASVLYGANALAGVVNIVTKDPPEKMSSEVSASYGTFNTSIFELSNGARLGNVGYVVTARKNSSDGHRENSECDGYDLSGKVNCDLNEKSRLIFSSGYSRQDKGVPGSSDWPSLNAEQDDEQYWFDVTHKQEFQKNACLTSKAFINEYRQKYTDPDFFIDQINRNQQLGVDIQQTMPLGENHSLLAGVYLQNDAVNVDEAAGGSLIGGEQKLTTTAAYLQDEISVLDRVVLTPGVRCDHQSEYGTEVSPKLSGLYRLTEKTSLRASVGRGFRAPTVDDLYWQDAYSAGNPNLDPEESIGYDAGIQQEFGSGNTLQITLFKSDVKRMITWADRGDGVWEAANIDKACLQGVETDISLKFTEQISGGVNYTFLDARDAGDTYDDNYLVQKPAHKAGCRLRYQDERGLKASLGAEYCDSSYSDRANTSKIGSYVIVDAGVSQKIGKMVEIFVNGNNLLDEEYEVIQGYPMPGASVTGGMKVMF